MILILISWIYILFTTINLGFGFDKAIGLKNNNFVITSILGLFSTTILASIWAIFGRINIEFHIFLLLLNIILLFRFRNSIIEIYQSFITELRQLPITYKVILILISFLIVAQCSSSPFVIDNESYYIQTIKWFNEYGFVKGLANLHIFFGQVSGWHVIQSVFNFSFLYKNFNDLSGFCLLLGNIFSFQKLNEYYLNQNKNYLIIGLLPLCNILFFQFISAPSPDIPVYIFSFILFFYFLESFKKIKKEDFNLIVILVLYLIYIKSTMLTLIIIPLILLLLHYKFLSGYILKPAILITITISLFIIKNMIISGSPIFPSKLSNIWAMDYAIPDSIENFYYNLIKQNGYFVTAEQYNSMSAFELFLRWLKLPKLHGLFNSFSFLLILVVPFFIYKFQNKKSLWTLYTIMILQLFLLFVTSPQYRFFLNFVLFFSLFCLVCIIRNEKNIKTLIYLSLIPLVVILLLSLNLNKFSTNNFMKKSSSFSAENIIFPHENTRNKTPFTTFQIGNLKYNSPKNNAFFWGTGDGDLPCINTEQVDYFRKHFNTIPQMRSKDLKDGFYAKKLSENE